MVPPDCQLDARVFKLLFGGSVLGLSYCALYDEWSVAVASEEGPGLQLRPVYQAAEFEEVREGMHTVAGVPLFALGVVPPYSGCIHSAWVVVEELGRRGFQLELRQSQSLEGGWLAWFQSDSQGVHKNGRGPTAPVAICEAAVKVARGLREREVVAGVS